MHNKENCSPSSNSGFGSNTTKSTDQLQSNGTVFSSLYSALLTENASLSATCGGNGGGASLYQYEGDSGLKYHNSHFQNHPFDSGVIQKHQDMVNHHSMCLNRLVETSKEVEALRQENTQLRALIRELQKQLSLLVQASLENRFGGSLGQTTPFDSAQGFRGFHIGENCSDSGKENCPDWNSNNDHEVSQESPNENNGVEVERFSLPKSISVRSNGYLKMAQSAAAGASNATRTKGVTHPRASSSTQPDVVKKVYVRGGKEEEPQEMVVYNQGMFKTELCNKWQETGTCPYGDHCQFAHGIAELRPVIRHPRYKTEVCRMVLAGVVCPYGHRCHFRHALSEEEKAIAQAKPRTMKLER